MFGQPIFFLFEFFLAVCKGFLYTDSENRRIEIMSLRQNHSAAAPEELKQNNLAYQCRNCSGFEEKLDCQSDAPYSDELAEHDKHEVLCAISRILGSDPCNFSDAEKIFDCIKYSVAEYVLKHEYNRQRGLSLEIALWLEEKKTPQQCAPLNDVIDTYLKKT